jgi:hypothetical protein
MGKGAKMKNYTDLIDESIRIDEGKLASADQFSSLTEQFMKKMERMFKMKGFKGGPNRISSATFEKSYCPDGVDPKRPGLEDHITISGWHGKKPREWGAGFLILDIYLTEGKKLSTPVQFKDMMDMGDMNKGVDEKFLHSYIKFLSAAEKFLVDWIVKKS